MIAVIQRVKKAELSVDSKLISCIFDGLCVYLCAEKGDTMAQADYIAKKIANMRIFSDDNGKMNLSVIDNGYSILLIPQFTLCADTSRGYRPDFTGAENPTIAENLFNYTAQAISTWGIDVKIGVFGADMHIVQENCGPVTIILKSK